MRFDMEAQPQLPSLASLAPRARLDDEADIGAIFDPNGATDFDRYKPFLPKDTWNIRWQQSTTQKWVKHVRTLRLETLLEKSPHGDFLALGQINASLSAAQKELENELRTTPFWVFCVKNGTNKTEKKRIKFRNLQHFLAQDQPDGCVLPYISLHGLFLLTDNETTQNRDEAFQKLVKQHEAVNISLQICNKSLSP